MSFFRRQLSANASCKAPVPFTFEGASPLLVDSAADKAIRDMKIFGGNTALGKKITNSSDSNYKKYQINISVQNSAGLSEYQLYLNEPLKGTDEASDYIDLPEGNVWRAVQDYLFEYGAVFEVIDSNDDIKQIKFAFSDNELPNADTTSALYVKGLPIITQSQTDAEGMRLTDDGIIIQLSAETLEYAESDDEICELTDMWLADNEVEFIYKLASEQIKQTVNADIQLEKGDNTITVNDGNNSCEKITVTAICMK